MRRILVLDEEHPGGPGLGPVRVNISPSSVDEEHPDPDRVNISPSTR